MEMQVDTQRGLRQVGQIGTTLWVGLVWNYCGRMQKHAGSLVFLTVLTHDGPFPDHEGHQGQSPPQILTILSLLVVEGEVMVAVLVWWLFSIRRLLGCMVVVPR